MRISDLNKRQTLLKVIKLLSEKGVLKTLNGSNINLKVLQGKLK